MHLEKLVRQKCKCCVTEVPMEDSKYINMVQLHIRASWDYPVWGNVITGTSNMAVAYVHDKAITAEGKLTGPVKFAIEFRDDEIIYHPIKHCRVCGCTDDDCLQCIATTGVPCHWIEEDLCSACFNKMNCAGCGRHVNQCVCP